MAHVRNCTRNMRTNLTGSDSLLHATQYEFSWCKEDGTLTTKPSVSAICVNMIMPFLIRRNDSLIPDYH